MRDLGRLEEAAQSYVNAIESTEKAADRRSAAVARGQLGTIRLLQGRLHQALDASEEARKIFEALQQPTMVATAWQQIGWVHQHAQQWDRAEAACQRSLRLRVELGNKAGQAMTLGQLGNLYGDSRRHEESAQLFQQAATLFEELGDSFDQARALSNLAIALLQLGRLDEAREAAARSAMLAAPFGHTTEPWKAWGVLHDIENAAGRPEASAAVRARAMGLYTAYRRDEGEPQTSSARLIAAVAQALLEEGPATARSLVLSIQWDDERLLPVRDTLLAIIDGARDPALAQDPRLHHADAVELTLLLESLTASGR